MAIVGGLLVPGFPLHLLRPDVGAWADTQAGYAKACDWVQSLRPDVIAIYSTQWFAVLDQLWQTQDRVKGVHVDENWYEHGDLDFDMTVDVGLAEDCIRRATAAGIKSKSVNYDGFPVDSGSIVADRLLNPDGRYPVIMASNNLYHDWDRTETLGGIVAEAAADQNKRVLMVGVGTLSGSSFRTDIDLESDHIVSEDEDLANRQMLDLIRRGEIHGLFAYMPDYVVHARVNMGFKHMAWIMGGLGRRYARADVLGYGPCYGSGGAVVAFTPE